MNLDRSGAVGLATQLKEGSQRFGDVEVGICPPSVYLDAVCAAVGDLIGVGAQNMYHQPSGAYTGELSASMLKDVGCRYVILGHSERRHVLGETNADVSKKLIAALAAGVTPILCVGETLAQREAGQTNDIVAEQFYGSLAGVDAERAATVVIAYEPVWAIGTGKVATPEEAEAAHSALRETVENRYNAEVAGRVRIQYGGSVKPENAAKLIGQPNIDGALVGGASLEADSFLGIIEACGAVISS
jgi:triosephosphate isomerase